MYVGGATAGEALGAGAIYGLGVGCDWSGGFEEEEVEVIAPLRLDAVTAGLGCTCG